MREIKFRGKRLDNGEWVVGSYIKAENRDLSIAHQIVPYESGEAVREVDPVTVGQYTGLKDKNGKEIYEGDILLDESGVYAVVYYSMGTFCVDFGEGFDLQYFTDGIHEICDVVSNIHDDPELLKTE
jgi:uncharacterized phage protein (TIGR01671 family)